MSYISESCTPICTYVYIYIYIHIHFNILQYIFGTLVVHFWSHPLMQSPGQRRLSATCGPALRATAAPPQGLFLKEVKY